MLVTENPTGKTVGEPLQWPRRGCTNVRASTDLITTRYRSNSAWIDLDTCEITPFLKPVMDDGMIANDTFGLCICFLTILARPTMAEDPNTTEPKMSKTAVIVAALKAHPDKMPKELAELLQADGWGIKAQRISTIKSRLKERNKRKPKQKPATKAAVVEAPSVVPAPATTIAEDAISFDSLKKAKQMAEQLGGIQQANAAIAALAELVD